jgi:HAD superfamily hydrolase (TIGR01509 family)
MHTQAIVFDLDGLLVDTEPLHRRVFNALLARYGVPYEISDEEFGRAFVGISQRENWDYLRARFALPASVEELTCEHTRLYEQVISDARNIALMPGARELLGALHARGTRLGIASSSPRVQVETILRGKGLVPLFHSIVTGSDVTQLKPAPEIYVRACKLLQTDASRCVALEDSASGAQAAKAAGVRVIVVPNRYTQHQDLSHADARVENLAQVLELIT